MLFQALHQHKDPNFVMVKYAEDKDESGLQYREFTAYQVSEQCVRLAMENTLRSDPGDPFRLFSTRSVMGSCAFALHWYFVFLTRT